MDNAVFAATASKSDEVDDYVREVCAIVDESIARIDERLLTEQMGDRLFRLTD